MSAEIEKYPRFRIAALTEPPAPHKRHRRSNAEVAAAKAAKEARKVARAARPRNQPRRRTGQQQKQH
jgi:hypothetical protein